MKRKILVFLLVIVFGTEQAMVFAGSGGEESEESTEMAAEQTEAREPEVNLRNTEDIEPTTKESETEISTQTGDFSKDVGKIGGGLKQIHG